MIVLGISGFFHHDPAAALLVDGKLMAAAEEERFVRRKHAVGCLPVNAARFCLDSASLPPEAVDAVAFSWSSRAFLRGLPAYLRRSGADPLRAAKQALGVPKRWRKIRNRVHGLCRTLSIPAAGTAVVPVAHHVAHAASAFLFSGYPEAAVFTADGRGELTASWAGIGSADGLAVRREWVLPDSLGMFFTSITQYLGLPPNDGEHRTMGMAPWGDPSKADLSDLLRATADGYRVDGSAVGLALRDGLGRGARRLYSDRLTDRFGPPRRGDGLAEPYTHVAAAAQALLEEGGASAVRAALDPVLQAHGALCLAGGVAMNVAWNRALVSRLPVRSLYVPPAAGDAGCAPGAAAWVAREGGDRIEPLETAALGPAFGGETVRALLEARKIPWAEPEAPHEECAAFLARGDVAGWFEGRMEFGPRALGQRSILAHPGMSGIADRINDSVKFREPWRPFCPAVLDAYAPDILEEPFDSPFMSLTFTVRPRWRELLAETVHVNATARAQIVRRDRVPGLHGLLEAFHRETGVPALLNTSLNRRGEPIACTPQDALAVFFGSGLDHLYLEGIRVSKSEVCK
ncbi:MAG: carbamoyltransferase family protein [Planctomycetota bacterium]|jgi:carbamoyltransferase